MKFTKYIIGLVTVLAMTVMAAPPTPVNWFSVTSTNKDTTLSYAVVSPRGTTTGLAPKVSFINAGSDLATAKISTYKVLAQATVTYTNSTTTLFVNSTNTGNNWQSGTILIRHLTDDGYDKRSLTSNSGSTNIIVTSAPSTSIPGDIVYYVTTTGAASLYWGVGTNSLSGNGSPLLVGEVDKPLLLEINATTAGQINVVSGDRVK